VDGRKVTSMRSLIDILAGYEAGDRVEVEVIRGDARRLYSVRLDPRPAVEKDVVPSRVVEAEVEVVVEVEPQYHGIEWFEGGFKKALAKAKKSGRPIIVDFYADWCGPCREMEETTFQDAGISKLSRNFIAVRVNVDDNAELADQYGVSSIPDVRLLDAGGNQITRMIGYRGSDDFAGALKKALGKKSGDNKKGLLDRRKEKKERKATLDMTPGSVVLEWEGAFEGNDLEDLDINMQELHKMTGNHPEAKGVKVLKRVVKSGESAENVEVDVHLVGDKGGTELGKELARLKNEVRDLRDEIKQLRILVKEIRGLLDRIGMGVPAQSHR